MMRYYVVSDIHSYFSLLKEALQIAGFFDETEPCMLVVCGDLLDRGSEAEPLIAFMLQLMKEGRLIYIRGNHEDLFVQCLHEIARGGVYEIAGGMSHHYYNKTWDSLLQISKMCEDEAYGDPNELVRRVIRSPFCRELLPMCVDYYETPNYIFIHGWIPCLTEGSGIYARYEYDPDWRNADISEWRSARWLNGMEFACKYHIREPNKTIVCGHWNTSYGHAYIDHTCSEWGRNADFSVFSADGILAIDASTANSHTVNCVVIDD